jgi:hypothetical protein
VLQLLESRRLLSVLAWSSGPSLPAPQSGGTGTLQQDGSILYAAGAPSATSDDTVLSLSADGSQWTPLTTLADARTNYGVAVDSSGRVDVLGGRLGSTLLASGYQLDTTLGGTTSLTNLDEGREQFATLIENAGLLWAIGGKNVDGTPESTVSLLSGSPPLWDDKTSMPQAEYAMAATSTNGYGVYVAGGATASGITANAYAFNALTQTWTTLPPMPLAVRDAAAAVGAAGKLYVIGGISASGAVNTVQSYDFARGTWTIDTALPAPVSDAAAFVDSANQIHVVGGLDASGNALTSNYVSNDTATVDLPPLFTSTPITSADPGKVYQYTPYVWANPAATYTLPTAPAGMMIDPALGQITWTPTADQLGAQSVTIRATNYLGSADQTFTITVKDNTPPTAPGNLHSTPLSTSSAQLTWTPSTDNVAVAGYRLYETRVVHPPRGSSSTITTLIATLPASATSLVVSVSPYASRFLYLVAYDAAGNVSAHAGVTATPLLVPSLSYTITSAAGAGSALVGSPVTIQLTNIYGQPVTYSMLSGPSGMTFDPTTGTARWTPAPSQAGAVTATFRGTNAAGSRIVAVSLSTYISRAPTGLGLAPASATTPAMLYWTPPSTLATIAGYKIYASLLISDGPGGPLYNTTILDTGASTTYFSLASLPAGSYLFSIQPYDYAGRVGLMSTALSTNLAAPPAAPAAAPTRAMPPLAASVFAVSSSYRVAPLLSVAKEKVWV